jgi:hypothetical protein
MVVEKAAPKEVLWVV